MKRILLLTAVALAAFLTGCNKPDNQQQGQQETVEVSLEVTDIADNCATIKASLTSGSFHGARIIEMLPVADVPAEVLESEIRLTDYVIENGSEIDAMPYEKTLTDVRIGADMFTAIIVYDASGRAADAVYVQWTPAGLPDGWSTDNNPGELGEIEW